MSSEKFESLEDDLNGVLEQLKRYIHDEIPVLYGGKSHLFISSLRIIENYHSKLVTPARPIMQTYVLLFQCK